MSAARVGIVHRPSAAAGLPEILAASAGLCTPVLLFRADLVTRHPALVAAARQVAETVVVQRIDAEVVRALALAGLTTFHDAELDDIDRVLAELGLPGAPAVKSPWDKLRQRHLIRAAGLGRVRALAVDSPHDLRCALADLGLPGVLKPRRSTASVDVAFLHTLGDVQRNLQRRDRWAGLLYEQLVSAGPHPSGVAWLADYVSVETVSDATGHHSVAVFDKLPVAVAGAGHRFDVRETGDLLPSRLPDPIRRAVVQLTGRVLACLGVRWRVTHTELKVTRDRLEVLEVNGRLGGEVARLVRLAGGPDLVRAALRAALGQQHPAHADAAGYVASIYVPFGHRDGAVRSSVPRRDLRAIDGVVSVDQVATAGLPVADSDFRTCSVVVRGDSQLELDLVVARVLDRVADRFAADGMDRDAWLSTARATLSCAEAAS